MCAWQGQELSRSPKRPRPRPSKPPPPPKGGGDSAGPRTPTPPPPLPHGSHNSQWCRLEESMDAEAKYPLIAFIVHQLYVIRNPPSSPILWVVF